MMNPRASSSLETGGLRYRLIDAFADGPFSGNPAAVFLLDRETWPDDDWMQLVALELSVSETAFVHPLPAGGPADWALRWFTPMVEDELCGHATLATAHALHSDRGAAGVVSFQTRSGVLVARTDDEGTVTIDLPRPVITDIATPEGLAEALGAEPEETYSTGTLGDILAVFPTEAAVRDLVPDFAALAEIQQRTSRPDRGAIVTARAADAAGPYDFVSRFFTPNAGIPEDPATGSAHTALAPYWSDRLGREALTGLQVSRRTGVINTLVKGDRIELSGSAVTVSEGRFLH
jgi:PhzF family phenazine biosynthesis protein